MLPVMVYKSDTGQFTGAGARASRWHHILGKQERMGGLTWVNSTIDFKMQGTFALPIEIKETGAYLPTVLYL